MSKTTADFEVDKAQKEKIEQNMLELRRDVRCMSFFALYAFLLFHRVFFFEVFFFTDIQKIYFNFSHTDF